METIKILLDIDGYSLGLGYFIGFAQIFYLANQDMRKNILISTSTGIGVAAITLFTLS